MTPLLLSSLWLALGAAVVVESQVTCPTAEDVAARVAALLPARQTAAAPDVVRIVERGDALIVTLEGADGTPLGERALMRGFPCADLAAATAVIVATWESDVHAEFRAAPLPAPPMAAPTTVAAPGVPAVAAIESPAPPPAAVAGPVGPWTPAAFDAGVALTGSLAPSSGAARPALGALFVASWVPAHRARRVAGGVRVAVGSTTERQLPLGAAHVRWRRIVPALGPTLRLDFATEPWSVDLHAEALLAWVTAAGSGFESDKRSSAFAPGLGLGSRLLWRGGRFAVSWIELAGVGWLGPQTAYAVPGAASIELPRFEVLLALGLGLRAGR